jgi:hypothetical protein
MAAPGLVAVIPGRGEIKIAPVSVCHQVSTIGQRFRPTYCAVPHPRLGVDRLADRAEQAQAREVVGVGILLSPLHERADGGGSGVEDGHLVLSMMRHQRSRPPASGVPSYMTEVAPLARGP